MMKSTNLVVTNEECYTSQYLADLHELAEHPGTYYALHIIPHSTKLKFAHSCE